MVDHNPSYFRAWSLAAIAVFFALFVVYAWHLHPEAPFMDTLRYLIYVDDSLQGRHSLWASWNQGEHRGMLAQTMVYWNARLFDLHLLGATIASGVVIAATAYFLIVKMRDSLTSSVHQGLLVALAVVSLVALFSLANWELFTLDVGAGLFAKNLVFILYWAGLERSVAQPSGLARKACMLAAGPAIILLMALGWGYAFVMTSLFLIATLRSPLAAFGRYRIALAASLLVPLLAYILAGSGVASYTTTGTPSVWNALVGVLFAMGSVFVGAETWGRLGLPLWLLAVPGLLLSLVCVTALVRSTTSDSPPAPPLAIAMILYACLHAAAVSYARARFDPVLAVASRYFMDLALALLGACWWTVSLQRRASVQPLLDRSLGLVVSVLVLVFVAGQAVTAIDESRMTGPRHAYFLKLKEISLKGVKTQAEADLLQQPLEITRRGVDIQRRYGWGVFR